MPLNIEIHRLHNQYQVTRGVFSPFAIQQRLDRLAREALPQRLAEQLESLFDDNGGLYCIRRLELDLSLVGPDWQQLPITAHWSQQVRDALRTLLQRMSPDEIRYYPSEADFLARFVDDLLHGRAWQDWAYQRLHTWRLLEEGELLSELILARPHWLGTLTRRLLASQRLPALLKHLSAAHIQRLFGQAFQGADTLNALAQPLAAWPDALPELPRLADVPEGFWHQAFAALCLLSTHQDAPPSPAQVIAAQQRTLLALAHARRQARGEDFDPQAPHPDEPDKTDSHNPDPILAALGQLHARARTTPQGRWMWQQLCESVPAPRASPREPVLARIPKPRQNRVQSIASAYAGVALALPLIVRLGLYPRHEPLHLYEMLVHLAGGEHHALALGDPGLWALCSDAAEHLKAPLLRARAPWPEADQDGVATPAECLAARVGDAFRKQLRGFEHSSLAYLRRQFFQQPGHLILTPKHLHVVLDQCPLATLIRMQGLNGAQDTLPWLAHRQLLILLPGEHP